MVAWQNSSKCGVFICCLHVDMPPPMKSTQWPPDINAALPPWISAWCVPGTFNTTWQDFANTWVHVAMAAVSVASITQT